MKRKESTGAAEKSSLFANEIFTEISQIHDESTPCCVPIPEASRQVRSERRVASGTNSDKTKKKCVRKEITIFINSFHLNLFLKMFRNLSSITYKKPEVHCFIPRF